LDGRVGFSGASIGRMVAGARVRSSERLECPTQ
jgi:hypothetical protein